MRDDPTNADALYQLAQLACREGQLADGVALARRALALDPQHARSHWLCGMALGGLGQREEALASFDRALACQPDLAEAHGARADLLVELGRHAEAVASYDRALAIEPNGIENWCNRGALLCDLGRYAEAVASFDRVIALKADFAEVLVNRGNALSNLGHHQEAAQSLERALMLRPDEPDWLVGHAHALAKCGRSDDAIASYDRALAIKAHHNGALMGRGITLIDLGRDVEALACFDAVLAVDPGNADAHNNRGFILKRLNRRDAALAAFNQALQGDPRHVGALNNRGIVLAELGRHAEALASYDRALAIEPEYVRAQIYRAKSLEELGRYDEAIAAFEKFRAPAPGRPSCLDDLVRCVLVACDWERLPSVAADFVKASADPTARIDPYTLLAIDSTPAQQLVCARNWVRVHNLREIPRAWTLGDYGGDKIRVAYLSADFHPSPVAYLTAELYEVHDRDRFEIIGISFGPEHDSPMQRRLKASFDRFIDVARMTDEDAARLVRDLKAHIAIDLMGHTYNSRMGILAQRAAPIQVNYLSFPGTVGADFIDYNIADRIVVPFGDEAHYSEKIVYLPNSYVANDSTKPIAERAFTRQEEQLPAQGFVFCCFNNTRKISGRFFDVWMRLLQRVPGSVLWMFRSNQAAAANLKKEAEAHGIDPRRLVFATARPEHAEHLARTRLADLFLDTLPFNACTTASDALWTGVPVLTCEGNTFIGRTATSLLHAVGLPELVTGSLDDYEALAFRLATEPPLLASIRAKLAQNRLSRPLFDAKLFARHIEAAYATMVEIWRQGGGPRSFSVVPRG